MDENKNEVVYLYLDDIIPNRFQPREIFDEQALKELAVSIREHGVIQPIIVRKVDNKYEIIAGERRYKASTMAGLTKIPAIIKNLDDKESSKVALIENLQRRDLSPIEEARTFQKILELEDNMTQEELAANVGKTQSSVSNKLRLLTLPEEVQDALLKNKISERHARSLLNIDDKNNQVKMLDRIIEERLTVRDLEKQIKILNGEEIEDNDSSDDDDDSDNDSIVSSSTESETKSEFKEEVEETEKEEKKEEEKEEEKEEDSEKEKIELDTTEKVEESTEVNSVPEKNNPFDLSKLFSSISSGMEKDLDSNKEESSNEETKETDSTTTNTDTDTDDTSGGVNYREAVTKIRNMVRELKADGQRLTMIEREENDDYVVKITISK